MLRHTTRAQARKAEKRPQVSSTSSTSSTSPRARERRRVARHIRTAERSARERDDAALPPITRLVRRLLLDELAAYRARGRFPQNREWPWQMPSFVDAQGTRCAMAHLMELGGAGALVAEIAEQRNFAFLRELADDARVTAWLAAAGIDVDEAAAIQPTYCEQQESSCICGGAFNGVGDAHAAEIVLEGVVVSGTSGLALRVDAIYGSNTALVVKQGDLVPLASYGPTKDQHVLVALGRTTDPTFFGKSGEAGASLEIQQRSTLVLDAKERPAACSYGKAATLPITKAQVVSALQAKDCRAELAKVDSEWNGKPDCSSGCACNAGSTGAGDASVAILLAIVGSVLFRRTLMKPSRR